MKIRSLVAATAATLVAVLGVAAAAPSTGGALVQATRPSGCC